MARREWFAINNARAWVEWQIDRLDEEGASWDIVALVDAQHIIQGAVRAVLQSEAETPQEPKRQPAPSTPQEDSNHVEGIDPFYTSR